jgi:hypothetical protein
MLVAKSSQEMVLKNVISINKTGMLYKLASSRKVFPILTLNMKHITGIMSNSNTMG